MIIIFRGKVRVVRGVCVVRGICAHVWDTYAHTRALENRFFFYFSFHSVVNRRAGSVRHSVFYFVPPTIRDESAASTSAIDVIAVVR